MITYSERYGELWEMFIKKTYPETVKKISQKRLIKLSAEFESFLVKLDEKLRYSG